MNIAVKNLQNKFPIPHSRICDSALKLCQILGLKKTKVEFSIVFVGTTRMRKINKQFLGHDYVTDVITFDLGESCEIIICPVEASKNAYFFQNQIQDELLLYVIHGLLHLAGYDDHSEKDIAQMRAKEQQLLKKIK